MEAPRKWWSRHRRGGGGRDYADRFTLPTIDDFQPLDTQEQEEMIRSFEREHQRQSRLWRGVFSVFLLGYGGFLIYSNFQQAWNPWELDLRLLILLIIHGGSETAHTSSDQRYHAYFMEDVHHWMTISAEWVAILCCLLALKGMLHSSKSHRQLLWYSFYVGLLPAVFWLYYMLRLPRFHWDILWLPFGPLRHQHWFSLCFFGVFAPMEGVSSSLASGWRVPLGKNKRRCLTCIPRRLFAPLVHHQCFIPVFSILIS
ncbi:hypothetical protein KSP39_PZI005817 [Platanthera zijinensis]|uniref:Transmembrane protein n=1 Tax=Platanthera zijinensis TaxID=2320716 RepID=A0AAP0BSY7_9ASPA